MTHPKNTWNHKFHHLFYRFEHHNPTDFLYQVGVFKRNHPNNSLWGFINPGLTRYTYIMMILQIFYTKLFLLYTLWLFNVAMENEPFIDDFPIKTSIYNGCSMAMLNNQRVNHPIRERIIQRVYPCSHEHILLVLSREWMECWWLLGLLLIVIVDHSLIPY